MGGYLREDNDLDDSLSRADLERIEGIVIERIQALGETPFRSATSQEELVAGNRLDLKYLRIFPSIGYRDANGVATAFHHAWNRLEKKPTLRLVTLRLDRERPPHTELVDHLDALGQAFSTLCDNVRRANRRKGLDSPTPVLSALHLRLSSHSADRFDPHIHCIWDIADDDLSAARSRMEQAFGQVWIDAVPVRKPRHCAFYICAGVVDYANIEVWPLEAVKAVWRLSAVGDDSQGNDGIGAKHRYRFIRRAGWFLRAGEVPSELEEDALSSPINGAPAPQEEAGRASVALDDTHPQDRPGAAHNASQAAVKQTVWGKDWKTNLIAMLPSLTSRWEYLIKNTVRKLSPDKRNLLHSPTLGEIVAVVAFIIECEQRDFERRYTDVLNAYGFDHRQLDQAKAKIEACFHLTLIHPGRQFIPTPEGLRWAQTTYHALAPVRDLMSEGRERIRRSVKDEGRLALDLRRGPNGKV